MEWVGGVLLAVWILSLTCASQEPKKDTKCVSHADVGFIVDSSTSLIQEYEEEKDFIKKLAAKLNISESGTHTSLVIFSEFASLQIPFFANNTPPTFGQAVDELPFLDSTTRIDRALGVASEQMFQKKNGMRENSKKVLILLTDGEQTKDPGATPPGEAIKPIYSLGAAVIIIGIGSRVNKAEDELRSMVQGKGVLFFAANFDELRLDSFLNSIVSSTRIGCITEVPKCSQYTDIGFVVDSSGSLNSDFEKEKEFVKLLGDAFSLSQAGPRGGLITFSDVANLDMRFSEFTTLETFKNKVNSLPFLGTITRIDLALELARTELFVDNTGRSKPNEKLLFLLTDGSQIPEPGYTEPAVIAKALRDSGIRLVIIAIGDGISMYELKKIAASQSKIYLARSFNDLLSLDFVQRIRDFFCKTNETSPPVKPCEMADVGFLLDSSNGEKNGLSQRKQMANILAERFNFSSSKNRAGLISFGQTSRLDIRFADDVNLKTFKSIVSTLPESGQSASIDEALRLASEQMFKYMNGMRLKAHKILIVLTGGQRAQNTDTVPLAEAVQPLRDAGVRVIVIGVGFKVWEDDLRDLVQRSSDLLLPESLNDVGIDTFVGSVVDTSCKEVGQLSTCNSVADVAFIIDSSTSMKEIFETEKFVVKELSESFQISPTGTHVSLVVFSDIAELVLKFSDYNIPSSFTYAVDQLQLMDSVTRIDLALELAQKQVFTTAGGMRPKVPNLVVLLTDGSQTKDYPHKDPAKIGENMRSKGVQFVVIGVGNFVKKDELVKLAGDERRVFLAKSNGELRSPAFIKSVAEISCSLAESNRGGIGGP